MDYFAAYFEGKVQYTKEVKEFILRYKNCPHLYFLAHEDKKIVGLFLLPEEQHWWIEFVEKNPGEKTFGFEKIKVTYYKDISYPERLVLQEQSSELEISPCGSNCSKCPQYDRCLACPATKYYKA